MAGESKTDGITGEWLSFDEIRSDEFFKAAKRSFEVKLSGALAAADETGEPSIKAAVRRRFKNGETICQAGAYGSTAFLVVEGQVRVSIPRSASPVTIPGRDETAWSFLRGMFGRRTQTRRQAESPTLAQIGEVSSYASLTCTRPPDDQILGPGDVFGVDTCINFYPREATVVAMGDVVVVEFLRSLLDAVRDAGASGDGIARSYCARAIRVQLAATPLFANLPADQMDVLADAAELLTPQSREIEKGVIYEEGQEAGALYIVRSGTVKLSRRRSAGEFIFSYLGRSAVFGLERVVPSRRPAPLVLKSTSHPSQIPPCEISGVIQLGRRPECEVRLDDRAVGRVHCTFEERDGDVYLIDNDSANYTILNGERIREAIVVAGDRVKIVGYEFELTRPEPDATIVGQEPQRLATATALDNFELVKIDARVVRRVATEERQLYEALTAMKGSVDTAPSREVSPDPNALTSLIELNLYNSQNTLLIDLDRCTRCDECVRACADAHGGVTRFTRDGPRFGKYLVTLACRSCTDPKCMIGCPVGSIRREDSLQIRIEDWCIGCQKCANQCPFGNINMLELAAKKEEQEGRLRATVCDLCAGFEGPNCVYACPHDAAIRVNPSSFLSGADTH